MVEMSASVMVNASTSFIQVEEESRTELFPSEILSDLDLSSGQATFSPALTVSSPGEAVNRSNLRLFLITCYSVLRATGSLPTKSWLLHVQHVFGCLGV